MVPVPVEYADEMRKFVLGLSVRASLASWPEGALEEYVAELSESEAEIVHIVNRSAAVGRPCPRVDLATEVGLGLDELEPQVQAMAERAWSNGMPALVLVNADEASGGLTYTIPTSLVARVYAALALRDQVG